MPQRSHCTTGSRRSRRFRRLCGALLTSLVVVTLQAGAAAAGEVGLRDPARDMWRLDASSSAATPAPHRGHGDVRGTTFRHGRHDIVVFARYRTLSRTGRYHSFTTRLATGNHRYHEVVLEASTGNRRGTVRVFDRGGRSVRCRTSHGIDYRRDVVRLVVSRSCLGRPPRHVRASTATYWVDPDRVILTDNPHSRKAHVRSWTRYLRAG